MLPNTIIAGTNKAGTTSVFRYLSSHPDVSISSKKEVSFFSSITGDVTEELLATYEHYFDRCDPNSKVRLEASPNYLACGKDVADKIRCTVPEAKLIFILREPSTKLLSNFRRRQQRLDETYKDLTYESYVNGIIDAKENSNEGRFSHDIGVVNYANLLTEYLEIISRHKIKIMFFDNLSKNPKLFLEEICDFIGIDSTFYQDFKFEIENKTRTYKNKKLQWLAFKINMKLEPMLNRFPKARVKIRALYNFLNEDKGGKLRGYKSYNHYAEKLAKAFFTDNANLAQVLKSYYPDIIMPAWLK